MADLFEDLNAAAKDWRSLNHALHSLTEEQVLTLLEEEKKGRRRPNFLTRLHARYSTLRVTRERQELLESLVTS